MVFLAAEGDRHPAGAGLLLQRHLLLSVIVEDGIQRTGKFFSSEVFQSAVNIALDFIFDAFDECIETNTGQHGQDIALEVPGIAVVDIAAAVVVGVVIQLRDGDEQVEVGVVGVPEVGNQRAKLVCLLLVLAMVVPVGVFLPHIQNSFVFSDEWDKVFVGVAGADQRPVFVEAVGYGTAQDGDISTPAAGDKLVAQLGDRLHLDQWRQYIEIAGERVHSKADFLDGSCHIVFLLHMAFRMAPMPNRQQAL